MAGDPFDLFRSDPEYRRRVEEDIGRRIRDGWLDTQLRLLLGVPSPPRPRPATQRREAYPDAIEAEFTEAEREQVIASVVSSQALSGVAISPEEAGRLLDELRGQPLPRIGESKAPRPLPLPAEAGVEGEIEGETEGDTRGRFGAA